MDPGGGRGGRAGSPPPDEPPPKRLAVDDYGHLLGGSALGPDGRRQLKENLQKRKRCLEDELRFLNNAGGLLDFAGSLSKTGTGSGPPQDAKAIAAAAEKVHALTDQEKLILQKAKAIESKHKFKVKWPEPPRRKTHHDYLLEEMSWMATDFQAERRWKMAVAKKVAHAVLKYHSEKKLKGSSGDEGKEGVARRNATAVAREVERFWGALGAIADRKRVLAPPASAGAPHLQFEDAADAAAKMNGVMGGGDMEVDSVPCTPKRGGDVESDSPSEDDEDDEETIAEADALDDEEDVEKEVADLMAENSLPIQEVLKKMGS